VSNLKNIAFQVDDEFHMKIKIQAAKEGKSIKEYIMEIIRKDLETKK
jgi:predicted HicB family RNase H-like nuclease